MGHLVNPIAFRVGWSRQWIDDYFVESSFYPEILHRLLRFRYFLNCFFSSRVAPFSFKTYVVSHFTFYFDLQGFGLRVYYYNSRMDPCWYSFWDKISPRPYGLRFFPKARQEPPLFAPWNRKAFCLLFILYHYSVNGVFDEPYRYRLSFFKAYQDTLQPSQFAKVYRRLLWRKYRRSPRTGVSFSERECYAFLHMMRYRTLQETGRINYTFPGYGLRLTNYEAVCQTFFRLLYVHQITKPYFEMFFEWLHFLGRTVFLKLPFSIRFFQVNNDQLSARFIAKFLALRFRQGFSARTVLRPIRKDLRLSKRLASRLHYKRSELKRTAFDRSKFGKVSAFAPLLLATRRFTNPINLSRKHLPTVDSFFLAYSLHRRFSLPRSRRLRRRRFRHYRLICRPWNRWPREPRWSVKTRRGRANHYAYLRLYYEYRFYFSFAHYLSTEAKKLFFLKGYSQAFFFEMAFNRVLSYHTGRALHQASSSYRRATPAALYHLTGGVLLSFLNFSAQSSIPSRTLDGRFGIKRRDFRSLAVPALGLQGFRIRLHGRFTRKQIAASYHVQEGSMPLSSMAAYIDYSFTTIPLRNSAIGVKVWLYKSGPRQASELSFSF